MRFFVADAIPGLSLSWDELRPPWVLPCTLSRPHKDRLCALLLSALRCHHPNLSALQLAWQDRWDLVRGTLRLSPTTLVQWQLSSSELLPELPDHFIALSELPPHRSLLDLDLPPSPRHVRFVEGHPSLGWLGTLKVLVLDALQGFLSEQPTKQAAEMAILLNDLATFLQSPIELLDCLQVLLSFDQQDLPLSEARTEALGRVLAERFVHALRGGLSLRQALAALQALPIAFASRAEPSVRSRLLPDDLYHLLLAMGLHEGPPDADSHPACALLCNPDILEKTRQRIAELTQQSVEILDEAIEPARDDVDPQDDLDDGFDRREAEAQESAALHEAAVRKLLKERAETSAPPEEEREGEAGIWWHLHQWDLSAMPEPEVSQRIANAAEQAIPFLLPAYAQDAWQMAGTRFRIAHKRRQAEAALRCALELAQQLHLPYQEAAAWQELGSIQQDQARLQEAQQSFEKALHLYREEGRAIEAVSVRHSLGMCLRRSRKRDEARDCFIQVRKQALELDGQPGSFRLAGSAALYEAMLDSEQLNFEDATKGVRRALVWARREHNRLIQGQAFMLWAVLSLRQGHLSQARRLCEQALLQLIKQGSLRELSRAFAVLGTLALFRGHSQDAVGAFLHAHALAMQILDLSARATAQLGLAAVHLRSRQLQAAEETLNEALEEFTTRNNEVGQANGLRGLVLVLLLRGGEWRDPLQRAEALAEAAQDLYGQWLGRLLRAVAERDAAQLAGVRDFFQGRGMPYEARIAAQLLTSDAPTRWDDALRILPFF